MDSYATAGVFRRVPCAVGSGIGSRSSSNHAKIPVSVGRNWLVSGFSDEGHLGYYSTSRRRIRCKVESETLRRDDKVKEKTRKKMLKKREKLLKNLSKDLSTLTQIGFGLDCSNPSDLLDQDQEKKISEAAEALLTQLQKLRAEEKVAKRKEEKCEDSSSSSSESSDSECEALLNMNKLKPKPVAENAPLMLSSMLTTQAEVIDVEPVIVVPESPPAIPDPIISLGKAAEIGGITKDESTETAKKIEVCMGGKCRKLGSEAILEELERVVAMEGGGVSVCGCKCLGKCKVGPNLRLSSSAAGGLSDNGVDLPASRSLRLGVGVEDASLILRQELGLAASPSLVD